MAYKKCEKGSEEWQLFMDFWKFRQEYHDPDNEDEWVVEMMAAGEQIIRKYQGTDIEKFAQSLILSHEEDIDLQFKKRKGDEN